MTCGDCDFCNSGDEHLCPSRELIGIRVPGAVDAFTTIDLMGEKTSGTKRQFCLPDVASPDQLKATKMQWLARAEANLDLAATLLVWGRSKTPMAVNSLPLSKRSLPKRSLLKMIFAFADFGKNRCIAGCFHSKMGADSGIFNA